MNYIRHSSSVWKKFLISGITSVPGYNFPQRWWTTHKNRISSGQGKMRPPAPPILDPMCKCGRNLKLWNRSTHPERSGSGPPLVFTLGLNPSVTRIGRRKRRADHWQNESSWRPPQNCGRADLTAAENEVSAGRLWPCAATGLGSPLQKRVAASRGKLKSLEDQRVEEETTSDSSRRGTSR